MTQPQNQFSKLEARIQTFVKYYQVSNLEEPKTLDRFNPNNLETIEKGGESSVLGSYNEETNFNGYNFEDKQVSFVDVLQEEDGNEKQSIQDNTKKTKCATTTSSHELGYAPHEEHPKESQSCSHANKILDRSNCEDDGRETRCQMDNFVCREVICGKCDKTGSFAYRLYGIITWIVCFCLLGASFFFIMIVLGAQAQERVVRQSLPWVQEILYHDLNTAEMCAFDDRGNQSRREKVESTLRTFPTPQAAHEAGYSILHCGACAACSNWVDLRQEWTTRKILGQVSLRCSLQTMMGGTYDDLVACTMEKAGFQEECARCWATDYRCANKHCKWIGLREMMMFRGLANIQVGPNDMTGATCEEAMCEASEIQGSVGFVPCSGASRRRMNIISDIARPGNQQCQHVDVLPWNDFFGPSTGHGDYPEGWGE